MRLGRALAAGGLSVALAACAPTSAHPHPRHVLARVGTTTTAPAPTTTVVSITPASSARASRHLTRPRPTITPSAAVSPPGCDGWATKDRATSDACWSPLIGQWSDWDAGTALAIIWRESHGNPWAKNPRSSAAGLFQILGSTPGDAAGNVALAHAMWSQRGWSPWRASGNW